MEVGGIMEASAMRLGGNKVRLLNLFRRHSLLWESAQPPPHMTPFPQSSSLTLLGLKYLSSQVLRGLLCSSLGICLYMFHDTVRLNLLYSLRDFIIQTL